MTEMDLAQLISQRKNLQYVLDNLSEGVLAHDKTRTITFMNRAAERITGCRREEATGRDCHEVFEGGFCSGACLFTEEGAELREHIRDTIDFVSKDGRKLRLEVSIIPMIDEQGQFVGVLNCFNDITEMAELRRRLESTQSFNGIIGRDHKMQLVFDLIKELATSDVPVVIQGESGTGKELVAGAIHGESRRRTKPFVPVNCGALPEGTLESELFGHVKGAFTGALRDKKGRFELADGGTIFLDEVGELAPTTQVKLLRVLQDGTFERVGGEDQIRVNIRLISATNRDLRQMVKKGQFREDLFYRLCVVPVELPPLRDRRNDIPLLAEHFLGLARAENDRSKASLSQAAVAVLLDYRWPGNVRELQNAIRYSLVKSKGRRIEPSHLPPEIIAEVTAPSRTRSPRPRKLQLEHVQEALARCGGNKARAARQLGVGRATLYRFLENLTAEQPSSDA